MVSGLIEVLSVCHEMRAFARLGANDLIRLAKWVHHIFAMLSDIL